MASSLVKPSSLKINDVVKFTTINPKDPTIHTGTVIGIGNYNTARMYGDVAATHVDMKEGAIKLGLPALADTAVSETFIVVYDKSGVTNAYAYSWLASPDTKYGIVELIEEGNDYYIKLYNVTANEASEAVSILKQKEYSCKLVSNI